MRESRWDRSWTQTSLEGVMGGGAVPLTDHLDGLLGYVWRSDGGGVNGLFCLETVSLGAEGRITGYMAKWAFADRGQAVTYGARLVRALVGESSVQFGSPIQWPGGDDSWQTIDMVFLNYSEEPTHYLTLRLDKEAQGWQLVVAFDKSSSGLRR